MRADRVRRRRRGLTVVAVLVCLVIVTLISGALLKVGIAHRDQVRAQGHKLQAEWLAQSGIDRAIAQLASKSDYTGETWELTHRDLDVTEPSSTQPGPAAVVRISVGRPSAAAAKMRL